VLRSDLLKKPSFIDQTLGFSFLFTPPPLSSCVRSYKRFLPKKQGLEKVLNSRSLNLPRWHKLYTISSYPLFCTSVDVKPLCLEYGVQKYKAPAQQRRGSYLMLILSSCYSLGLYSIPTVSAGEATRPQERISV
jgi:hypothetical protein